MCAFRHAEGVTSCRRKDPVIEPAADKS